MMLAERSCCKVRNILFINKPKIKNVVFIQFFCRFPGIFRGEDRHKEVDVKGAEKRIIEKGY